MKECKICNRFFTTLYGLSNHIRKGHKIQIKKYYDMFLKKQYEEYCNNPKCLNKFENRPNYTRFGGIHGYYYFCSKKCQYSVLSNDKKVRRKKQKLMLQKWNNPNSKLNSSERNQKISNSLKGKTFSKERRKNLSVAHVGQKAWNKNKKLSKKHIQKLIISHRRTIKEIKKIYPIFCKIENMRYNPDKPGEKEIQVHCKNHNCPNSKEKGGWFTPTSGQIYQRVNALEKLYGSDGNYFYCSEECKQFCPLYRMRPSDVLAREHLDKYYTDIELEIFKNEVLKRANFKCEYCGEKATHCHHIRPQKLEPFFSLDPDFGVACCKDCHYKYGHKTGTECSTGNLGKVICI